MPRSKRKPRPGDKSQASLSQPTESDVQQFPHAQYVSVLGTYAVLICFAAVALPSSSEWLGFQPIPQATSIDRPQHPLLNPITANPTGTVITVSIGVFVISIWWAGWMRLWWTQEKHLARIENNTLRAQEKIFKMRSALLLTLLGVCVYYVLLILFGAPLLSHTTATLSLSVLLSILTVYTPSYTLPLPKLNIPYVDAQISVGPDDDPSIGSVVKQHTWIRLFSERNLPTVLIRVNTTAERAVAYPVFGTLCGCWIGVIPLALDWDRPWQAWPLLPAYGALLGHVLGSIYALCISGWKRLVELGQRAKIE